MGTFDICTSTQSLKIIITDAAMVQAANVIADDIFMSNSTDDTGIRVTAKRSGCAGVMFSFALENVIAPGDSLFKQDDIYFVFDEFTAEAINGATIDYVGTQFSSKFVVTKPGSNVCGCGKSIS